MIDLATLISRTAAGVKADEAKKATEKRLKASVSDQERSAAQLELDALRAIIDWRTIALVLVFDAWECRCGRRGRAPQGLFLCQEHTRMSNSIRLVPPKSESELPSDLPRRIRNEERIVAMCQRCAEGLGFTRPFVQDAPAARGKVAMEPGPFRREWLALRAPDSTAEQEQAS